MILYTCAVWIYQGMQYADRAGKQGLLKYSYGEFLDNLGALRGIARLQPTPAVTTMRFQIEEALASTVQIPAGTRVTNGNEVYFATDEYAEIAIGQTYVDVLATSTETGMANNGFRAGEIKILVETLPYISSVSNITETSGGSDIESDDSLADRIYIASSAYSVAGPADAYIYWTKTVSSDITDVKVTSPAPCEVDVRFIMEGGELPEQALIDKVASVLNDSNVKPLTDKVTVSAPTTVNCDINLTYYINESDKASAESIQNLVTTAVDVYKEWQCSAIGRDINPSYLIGKIMAAGAKRVDVVSPVQTTLADTEVAAIGTVNIVYGGIEND
ncbi:MAG: baseplate J/gp47 family protein, partial [Lachnospiraceae bacterium]|nr:baseplate J/gp47 family protein [Lachnospiraceae bacterium]